MNTESIITDQKLECIAADYADDIVRDNPDGNLNDWQDAAFEYADGSEWVIYYYKAHQVCQNCYTHAGEAFFEDCGPWPSDRLTYDGIASIIAFGELRARICDHLSDEDEKRQDDA